MRNKLDQKLRRQPTPGPAPIQHTLGNAIGRMCNRRRRCVLPWYQDVWAIPAFLWEFRNLDSKKCNLGFTDTPWE